MPVRDVLVAPIEKKFRAAVVEQVLNHMKAKYVQEFAAYEPTDDAQHAYEAPAPEDKQRLQAYLCSKEGKVSQLILHPVKILDEAIVQSRKLHLKHFWAKSDAQTEDKKLPLSLIKYLGDHYLKGEFGNGNSRKANTILIDEVNWTVRELIDGTVALKHDALPKKLKQEILAEAFLAVPAIMQKSIPQLYGGSRADVASLTKTGRAY